MTAENYIIWELERFLKLKNISNIVVTLQKPKEEKFGDFATNLAMQLAQQLKSNPRTVAEEICQFVETGNQYIDKVEIAGPGFINFFTAHENLYEQLEKILSERSEYGKTDLGNGKTAMVEFVSANPTGPLTIGHGRQAVLGDTIANLLEAVGYDVTREYYFNNAGRQMRMLGNSVYLRYQEILGNKIEFPDDHYQGEYIKEIANSIYEQYKHSLSNDPDNDIFKNIAEQAIFEDIKKTVKRLGFSFDVFYNENSLYETGKIDEVIQAMDNRGYIEKREGATWFLTTKLGSDQDRVYIKSTGEPTYRLPDTAYHIEKIKRGFDLMIDIFGADHIATYPDVLSALDVLGYDVSRITVLIHQFVTLTEDGEVVKMSTRKANFITLDELMDEVGVDVTRYFFIMRQMNSHLNFDLSLAKTQSDENPVFYIQYAHARICSILSLAESRDIDNDEKADLTNLKTTEETNLIKHLIDFPNIVESCAINYAPHRLSVYLFDLATLFHKFYTECRVISDDKALTFSRMALIDATRTIIANGLKLLGISVPEKM